jgi:FAD-dependent sensor of blue light
LADLGFDDRMEPAMIEIVYTSAAAEHFSEEQLIELLRKSRINNTRLGITGMLLYKNGEFMQVLEGEEDAVRSLSKRIAADPRHTNFKVLMDRPCAEREFPDWSMGFTNLDAVTAQDVPGYSRFLDSPLRSLPFTTDPTMCRRFLLLFKNRVISGVGKL